MMKEDGRFHNIFSCYLILQEFVGQIMNEAGRQTEIFHGGRAFGDLKNKEIYMVYQGVHCNGCFSHCQKTLALPEG
jgi:hypothetical protein